MTTVDNDEYDLLSLSYHCRSALWLPVVASRAMRIVVKQFPFILQEERLDILMVLLVSLEVYNCVIVK